MKQFSVKDYIKDPSRNVVTRDGKPARVICTDLKHKYPVIAALDYGYDEERIFFYDEHGRLGGVTDSACDLFFTPEKKMTWANLYCTELGIMFTGEFFKTEEDALKEKVKDLGKYITTFKVQWEE